MAAVDYVGPFRHAHISIRETEKGVLVTLVEFEVLNGQRRFRRQWPPVPLRLSRRPQDVPSLLVQCGELLAGPGRGATSAPPAGATGESNPQR